ncbi:MAG: hypothetical protein ACE5JK_07930, partial [Candidatus Omnitrophota bacterium]
VATSERSERSQRPFNEGKHKMAKKKKVAKKKAKRTRKAPKGLWTTREVNLLKKLFPTTPTSKIAARLGRRTDAVKKKASRMGLRKSKRYLKSIGRV